MHTIQFNGERLAYKTEGIINAFECVIIIWTRKYISLFLQRANSAPKHGICSVDIKYRKHFLIITACLKIQDAKEDV